MSSGIGKPPFVIFLDIDGVVYNKPGHPDALLKKMGELFPDEKPPYKDKIYNITAVHFFNKIALDNLDYLIEETKKTMQVWIVISSSWRDFKSVEELKTTYFGIYKFSNYIVDKTTESELEEMRRIQEERRRPVLGTDLSPYCTSREHTDLSPYCTSREHAEAGFWRCRASEIQYWLKQHPEVTEFVVLDDYDDHMTDNFGEKFVKTNMCTLLTRKNVEGILKRRELELAN